MTLGKSFVHVPLFTSL